MNKMNVKVMISTDINTVSGKQLNRKNVIPMLVAPWTELPKEIWKKNAADMWLIYAVCGEYGSRKLLTGKQVEELFSDMKEEEIFRIAAQNLKDMSHARVRSVSEMIRALSAAIGDPEPEEDDVPMYTLIGDNGFDVPALLLDPEIQNEVASIMGDGYYILPSSIHEVIFVPKDTCDDVSDLTGMIRFINSDTVSENERLSDHAYVIADGKLTFAHSDHTEEVKKEETPSDADSEKPESPNTGSEKEETSSGTDSDDVKIWKISISDSCTYRIRTNDPDDALYTAIDLYNQRTPDVRMAPDTDGDGPDVLNL